MDEEEVEGEDNKNGEFQRCTFIKGSDLPFRNIGRVMHCLKPMGG